MGTGEGNGDTQRFRNDSRLPPQGCYIIGIGYVDRADKAEVASFRRYRKEQVDHLILIRRNEGYAFLVSSGVRCRGRGNIHVISKYEVTGMPDK